MTDEQINYTEPPKEKFKPTKLTAPQYPSAPLTIRDMILDQIERDERYGRPNVAPAPIPPELRQKKLPPMKLTLTAAHALGRGIYRNAVSFAKP